MIGIGFAFHASHFKSGFRDAIYSMIVCLEFVVFRLFVFFVTVLLLLTLLQYLTNELKEASKRCSFENCLHKHEHEATVN